MTFSRSRYLPQSAFGSPSGYVHPPKKKIRLFLLVQQGFVEFFPFFWQKMQTHFALDQRTCTWDEVQPQEMP